MAEPTADQAKRARSSLLIVLALCACLAFVRWTPDNAAPFSLGLGILLALTGLIDPGGWGKNVSKKLIQACVVLLGFTMDFNKVLAAGLSGLAFAAGTILVVFTLGYLLSKVLKTNARVTTLVSSGTAICGGSAIAAVSSVIGATSAETSVALATVFILNGVGLYLFPVLGHALHLSDGQFGTWAAISIHDVSSVVGAARTFSEASLETATTVKLSRALWIVPVALACQAIFSRGKDAPQGSAMKAFPWFVLAFIVACFVGSYVDVIHQQIDVLRVVSRTGLSVALFLIGAGLNRAAIVSVGWRALTLGVILWCVISVLALVVVRATVS
jgi:hypothetical protein